MLTQSNSKIHIGSFSEHFFMKGISGLQFPYTVDYYIDISYLHKCGGIYFLFHD